MQFEVATISAEGTTPEILTVQENEATETLGSLLSRAQHGSVVIQRV